MNIVIWIWNDKEKQGYVETVEIDQGLSLDEAMQLIAWAKQDIQENMKYL